MPYAINIILLRMNLKQTNSGETMQEPQDFVTIHYSDNVQAIFVFPKSDAGLSRDAIEWKSEKSVLLNLGIFLS